MLKDIVTNLGLRPAAPEPCNALSRADRAALKTYLQECDNLEPGISEGLLDYLLSGRNESALLRARALPGRDPRLTGHMPHVRVTRGPNGIVRDEAAAARNLARITARRRCLLESESWDAAVFRRLGEVIAALNGRTGNSDQDGPGTPNAPPWFRALLGAVHSTSMFNNHGHYAYTFGPRPVRRLGILDAERCVAMLALDQLDAGILLDVCFGATDYAGKHVQAAVVAMPGLPAALAADAAGVVTALRRLPAAAQADALTWIGKEIGLADPIFYEETVRLLATGGKLVAAAALTALRGTDRAALQARGETMLASADPRERLAAVQILGRIVGRDAAPALQARAASETVRGVEQALREALLAIEMGGDATADDVDEESGYRSADGAWIEIPAYDLPPDGPFPPDAADILREAAVKADRAARDHYAAMVTEARARHERGERHTYHPGKCPDIFDPCGVDVIPAVAAGTAARGEKGRAARATHAMLTAAPYPYGSAWKEFASALDAVISGPAITPHHVARLKGFALAIGERPDPAQGWATLFLSAWGGAMPLTKRLRALFATGLDARATLAMASPWAPEPAAVVRQMADMAIYGQSGEERDGTLIASLWPLVASHLTALDHHFGLALAPAGRPSTPYSLMRALDLLSLLPHLPRRFLPGVLDWAMGGHPIVAPAARALLKPVKAATPMLAGLLQSSDAVIRQRAAGLLAQMGDKSHIAALRAALAREKSEAVRAALLRTLVALGDDISDQFSERNLLAQAKAGLAKSGSKLATWFPMDALPAIAWEDGRTVPHEVVRWWLLLTEKIKLPGGDPLMRMTLDRLDRASAAQLGMLVLSAFIAYDTRQPSASEAAAYAEQHAAANAASRRRWQPDYTTEQAFEELRRGKLGEYLGSANDFRGILALARHAPGADAVQLVRGYFRDHYPRTAQCKALLECLAANPHPAALQMVLATANRYRTAGVQKRAAELVDQIAQENGWTRDELADRTVPTGGLDADGVLELPIGDKIFRVLVDAAQGDFAVTLTNPAGKAVKALPALPENAAPELAADLAAAKKAFASLRKELKQTATLQTARLYEAMCVGRVWSATDFESYLLRHPVLGPLCRRLVFTGLAADGAVAGSFRPMSDGTLTGADDAPVRLDAFASVRVAHRAMLPAPVADAWASHLVDYEVAALFDQFGRPLQDLARLAADAVEIEDRKGWMIETFKLRGTAGRLGYQRAQAEDGGFFDSYLKPFGGLAIAACVRFTGAALPETSAAAALISLSFVRQTGSGFGHAPLKLRDLPPVLLHEVWNDFHRIADAGTGFDPAWEKKAQW